MDKKIALGLGIILVGLLSVVAVHHTAQAGAKNTSLVSITINSDGTGTASGSMGLARNTTADSSEFVGCSIAMNGPSGSFWGCSAQTPTRSISCAVDMTDPQWVGGVFNGVPQAGAFTLFLDMMNSDSYIKFQWRTVNGNRVCTQLRVENDSRYQPRGLP